MSDIPELVRRVDTDRFGRFVFQTGASSPEVQALLTRVEDAHELFRDSALSRVAHRLEKEVLVSSIYGTNTIEGGRLTEQETEQVLNADLERLKEEEERRVANIKRAYDMARDAAARSDWQLDLDFICRIHAAITEGLRSVEQRNEPGMLRDNRKNFITEVGDASTGGKYKPPQYGRDIARLLSQLVDWHAELSTANVPALIRAPLVHLYFELIHPFWDGNGRVGRVLEATVLLAAGYRYAPFALARYYLDEIRRYFTLFNVCRHKASKKEAGPNADFIAFHLEGMLATIKRLHGRVNILVEILLFESHLRQLADTKEINPRQYAIIHQVMKGREPTNLDEMRRSPWYLALYTRLSDKTKQRDLARLQDRTLLILDSKGRLWPAFTAPDSTPVKPERHRSKR